jgi:hypothetical protein
VGPETPERDHCRAQSQGCGVERRAGERLSALISGRT